MNKSYDVYMCRAHEKGLNLYSKENPIKVKPIHPVGDMGVAPTWCGIGGGMHGAFNFEPIGAVIFKK